MAGSLSSLPIGCWQQGLALNSTAAEPFTGGDPSTPWLTLADPGRAWQTLAYLFRRWQTLAYLFRPWQTLTNPDRTWQIFADPGRPWQTLADPGRLWQTLAEPGRPLQSLAEPDLPAAEPHPAASHWSEQLQPNMSLTDHQADCVSQPASQPHTVSHSQTNITQPSGLTLYYTANQPHTVSHTQLA